VLKAIKIKLYPSDDQKVYMNKLLGSSRFVYNYCLNHKITEYKDNKKSTSFGELGKILTSLKKQKEHKWLKESHSKVLQQSLINMNKAYDNFFKSGSGFPKFKSKHQKQSCRFPVDAISGVKGNRINIITTLKDIHFKCSSSDMSYLNKHQHLIKSGTLSKTKSGNYYFSVLIDRTNKTINKPINDIIGIDLGIKDFIITSEGHKYENLKSKRSNQKKLGRLHRELSRKQKGSSNRNKSRIKLAKLYEKINNKKDHYLHQVVNQLLSENQTIVIENLNVKGMMKRCKVKKDENGKYLRNGQSAKSGLNKSIQELSLNRFKEILKYKASWYDREVIEVDRWFASSKLCSGCGYKNKELTLKDREWICPECGLIHDRDINAAINIKQEGKRIKEIGMSLPELTPLENKSLDPRGIRKQMLNTLEMV
jgi:putative transposase